MNTKAVLVRRNGIVGAATAISCASVIGAALLSTIAPRADGMEGVVFAFGAPVAIALVAGWLTYWRAWRTLVHLKAIDGALYVDEAIVSRAGTFSRGHATVLADGRARVVVQGRLYPLLRFEVGDLAIARALLAALRLDRREGSTYFRIRRLRAHPNVWLLGAFLAVPFSIAMAQLGVVVGLLSFLLAILALVFDFLRTRAELTVGSDGIEIRSPIQHEFLPHPSIRRIERIWPEGHEVGSRHDGELVSWGFEIETADGKVRRFDTRPERFDANVWLPDPIFDAAAEAWKAAPSGSSDAAARTGALLARGSRSARQWVAALREIAVDGAGGYRVAALDERALFAVLNDATAPRELRAGAAIALGGRDQRAPKLRVAVDDLADPVVRRIATTCLDPEASARLESELDEAFAFDAPVAKRAGR